MHGVELHPSTAAIQGHPLHPMAVPIPIGMLVAAAASDVTHLMTGQAFYARMSRWLIRGGLIGGLVSATVGLIDFATIRAARGPTGVAHAGGNATILVLNALSLALRRGSTSRVPGPAMLLTGLAALMLAVTGWLGGELAHRKGIGVSPSSSPEDD